MELVIDPLRHLFKDSRMARMISKTQSFDIHVKTLSSACTVTMHVYGQGGNAFVCKVFAEFKVVFLEVQGTMADDKRW
ncbi:MAG: hypothetical protein MZU95_14775 [Desulfomicrobium escambiense]|nr:hypothetical protein [Desulfomicrobium escambiense]